MLARGKINRLRVRVVSCAVGLGRCRIRPVQAALAALLLTVLGPQCLAQDMSGRIAVRVTDPAGRGVPAQIELEGRSPAFAAQATADGDGRAVLTRIPPGSYRLTVAHEGLASEVRSVEVRSSVPRNIDVALRLETVREQISVVAEPPLLDPRVPSQPVQEGRTQLDRTLGTTLGRSVVDVVTTMPGWLLEANAVLHPRGSEYDTQYVIDGLPLYDNRSIAFAPPFETDEFEAVRVLTAGIPAEYGRRLGGVIALDTRRAPADGHRSEAALQAGSYSSRMGTLTHQYARRGNEVSFGLRGGATDRYLDPPSLENFTNSGSSGGANLRVARDVGARDRLTFYARSNRTRFLVPNDLAQQAHGQRQDRLSSESAGQVHYQSALSSTQLLAVRGMFRDLGAELWSNALALPVFVQQDRGFREGALMADLTVDKERHTLKLGGDLRVTSVREAFQMAEPDELPELDLDFFQRERAVETSAFVQDSLRLGSFAANIGLRYDYYSLLRSENALSPRLAASYLVPKLGVQAYASYDRIFQPPPRENLLLSSAGPRLGLEEVTGVLVVPASRANFFEVGLRRALGNVARLDVKHYWRDFRHAIDDDVLLNTGLSFPITFDSAKVEGTEARLELPSWGRVSAVASYSHMVGIAASPVTGGLFVEGGEAEELRDERVEFPISQDQRNTVAAHVQVDVTRRVWVSAGVRYGSGLPIELEDDDDDEDLDEGEGGDDDDDAGEAEGIDDDDDNGDVEEEVSAAILDRVNLSRGRVRPVLSIDFSVGARVWERGNRSATLQFDLRNATDRLNVINFTGLFSGTALAPGRQATVQLRLRF